MECLVGAQKSKYINEGILHPLESFPLDEYVVEKTMEKVKIVKSPEPKTKEKKE
ncbi:MAG: hypothetical protein LBT70_00380 [Holosporaceae bacterium]|jgi:hypothetical protein|nr:hypothetical protein [Holosporaceae bacterium]